MWKGGSRGGGSPPGGGLGGEAPRPGVPGGAAPRKIKNKKNIILFFFAILVNIIWHLRFRLGTELMYKSFHKSFPKNIR